MHRVTQVNAGQTLHDERSPEGAPWRGSGLHADRAPGRHHHPRHPARHRGAVLPQLQGPRKQVRREANIRAVLPDIESYNADKTVGNQTNDPDDTAHGGTDSGHADSGYVGMTAALLKGNYDQAFPSSVFVYPGDATTTGAPTGTGIAAVTSS